MLSELRYSLPILILLPVSGFCCDDECNDSPTGPGNPTVDLTNDWAFSTSYGGNQVCTWNLELVSDASGRITGTGKQGFISLFLGGAAAQMTAMNNHPVTGSVDDENVTLTFNACDSGDQTFAGSVVSDTEMAGANWLAEVVPERPDAPSGLNAVLLPPRTLEFRWSDNSSVETGFEINWTFPWQCQLNEVDYHWRELAPDRTSFSITNVASGNCVWVRIQAYRFAGKYGRLESEWTPWTNFIVP